MPEWGTLVEGLAVFATATVVGAALTTIAFAIADAIRSRKR